MRRLTRRELATSTLQGAARWIPAHRHERASVADAERLTLRRIRRVVDHAYATVPFYRDRFGAAGYRLGALRSMADLASLPLTSKDDLVDLSIDDVISRDVERKNLLPSITSGTSGSLITVWHDGSRMGELGLAALLRLVGHVTPYRPWYRMMYVYTSRFPVDSVLGMFRMRFVPTMTSPAEIATEWQQYRPDVVWIYPSRLRDLLDIDPQLPPPRLVSVGSELSSGRERKAWEARLRCPVRDQYGTEELGMVAVECRNLRRHLLADVCHLEILSEDGAPAAAGVVGEVVGTNLENLAMPFIRYRQGDRAALHRGGCACGRTTPIVDPIEGRTRVEFATPSGSRVGSGLVVDALYGLVLDAHLPLRGYRLVTGTPPALLLVGDLTEAQIAVAVNHMRARTGLVVAPHLVDRLPAAGPGKRDIATAAPPSESHRPEVGHVPPQPQQDIGGEGEAEPTCHETAE